MAFRVAARAVLRRSAAVSGAQKRLFSNDSGGIKAGGFSFPAPLSLQQIVKLELLVNEESEKIKTIWADYHAPKDDAVAATLSGDDYKLLKQRAKSAPFFVIPVNRQGGFFNMLCQFQDKCFLVTYLEAYKENPALAPPCLTVSLYDDLLEKKDVGLIRADIVNMLDKPVRCLRFISVNDALWPFRLIN
jgi:ATP synthase mitochondrial F1 complex assembly factor 1